MKPLRQQHIFLVDNDEDDRMFFRDALQETYSDITLTSFENGEQFIAFMTDHQGELPDVVFIDLNMPRKNGIECLMGLKALHILEKLKVLIYSTSANPAVINDAFVLGAYGYLCKPSTYNGIKSMIKQSLQKISEEVSRPDFENFVIEP